MSNSAGLKASLRAAPHFDGRLLPRRNSSDPEAGQAKKSIPSQVDHFGGLPVKELTERHQGAVSDLYVRYGEILRSAVGQVIKEEAQVEDMVQEVFLRLYRDAVRESFEREIGAARLTSQSSA